LHILLDPASGTSDDYYTSQGSRFVFIPELRDNGFGFLLPPEYIIPSGEEFWAALTTMLDIILEEKIKQ
jgi:extracellular matrix protein 14